MEGWKKCKIGDRNPLPQNIREEKRKKYKIGDRNLLLQNIREEVKNKRLFTNNEVTCKMECNK